MTVRLVILGLLLDRPLYGYEIKQIIEEHMSDWTSIAFGSIYFAIDKLAAEGFVQKVRTERESGRPSRSVYEITTAGRKEFIRLLEEQWQQFDRQYFPLDICLFFLDSLPRAQVRAYLALRKAALQAALTELRKHRAEQVTQPEVPWQAGAIFDHALLHLKAELQWITGLLNELESGKEQARALPA